MEKSREILGGNVAGKFRGIAKNTEIAREYLNNSKFGKKDFYVKKWNM